MVMFVGQDGKQIVADLQGEGMTLTDPLFVDDTE